MPAQESPCQGINPNGRTVRDPTTGRQEFGRSESLQVLWVKIRKKKKKEFKTSSPIVKAGIIG